MTSKRLEQLNRKARILCAVNEGRAYGEIAIEEGVTLSYVSEVARAAGIYRQQEEKTQ